MKKLLIALLSISILTALGCGDPDKNKDQPAGPTAAEKEAARGNALKKVAEDNKEDIKKLAENYSDIGFQAYSDAIEGAENLKAKITALVQAAEAVTVDPNTNSSDTSVVALQLAVKQAQIAWRQSRPSYLQTEVYRFYGGPINQVNPFYSPGKLTPAQEEKQEIEPFVNAWPIDESYIDYTCLYVGVPTLDGAPVEEEGYHCDPMHMKLITGCGEATGATELDTFAKEYTGISDPSSGTPEEQEAKQQKIDAVKEKVKNNLCWAPKEIGSSTPKKFYSFTNMKSFLGETSTTGGSIIGGAAGSFLDGTYGDSTKVEIQKKLRALGGGDPIAGQNYGDGEEKNPCAKDQISLDNPTCHHIDQNSANVSTGYHAIEFVLWGQDFAPEAPGTRALSDYTPKVTSFSAEAQKSAHRRLVYLQAAVDMLINDLTWVRDQWKANTDNYRKKFVGLADSDPSKVVSNIFTGMYELSVGETGGERIQPALELQNQEEEHSCFSDNTQVDMQMDIQGIVNVFNGTYLDGVTCGNMNCSYPSSATTVVTGTGMKPILEKYQSLCDSAPFKDDEDFCSTAKKPSVITLGNGLQDALRDAKGLLGTAPGEKYFDQEVFKVWPPTLNASSTATPNPGRVKLQKLADALSDLDAPYAAFARIITNHK